MRNAAIIALCAITLASCYGGPAGEVVGVYPREDWVQVNPYGMNYIHYGSYTMGPSDQDVPYALTSRSKTVTVPAFYIDIHEISNNEYRQFVYWVRDSLFRDVLQENDFEEYFTTEDEQGRELDRFINKGYVLNWDEPIDWENEDIFDALYDEFYFQGLDRFYDQKQLDTRKFNFKYFWINLQAAARKSGLDFEINEPNELGQLNSIRGHSDRAQFVIEENTNVYPDTLCWMRDFTYGFNEPLTETYFWHPAYDDYPVVGVTWGKPALSMHGEPNCWPLGRARTERPWSRSSACPARQSGNSPPEVASILPRSRGEVRTSATSTVARWPTSSRCVETTWRMQAVTPCRSRATVPTTTACTRWPVTSPSGRTPL